MQVLNLFYECIIYFLRPHLNLHEKSNESWTKHEFLEQVSSDYFVAF